MQSAPVSSPDSANPMWQTKAALVTNHPCFQNYFQRTLCLGNLLFLFVGIYFILGEDCPAECLYLWSSSPPRPLKESCLVVVMLPASCSGEVMKFIPGARHSDSKTAQEQFGIHHRSKHSPKRLASADGGSSPTFAPPPSTITSHKHRLRTDPPHQMTSPRW